MHRQIILASTSPYRRELFSRLLLPFDIASPEVDESPKPREVPSQLAVRLAKAKARAVAERHPEAVVVGSDQVANLLGQALGKPGDHARAVAQLQRMSGHAVVFHTAVSVQCLSTGFNKTVLTEVKVQFRNLSPHAIEHYLRTEKPYDCAGSAKSEGLGIALLERIENDDPTALIGLPLIRTAHLLREAGIPLL